MSNGYYGGYSDSALRQQERAIREHEKALREHEKAMRHAAREQERAVREQEKAMREHENAMRHAAREQERAIRERERAMRQAAREQERAVREQERAAREQQRAAREMEQGVHVNFSDGTLEFQSAYFDGGGTSIRMTSCDGTTLVTGGGGGLTYIGDGGITYFAGNGDYSIVGGEVVSHSSQNPPQTYRMGPATVVMSDPENFNGQFSCTSSRTSRSRNGETYTANSTVTLGPGGVSEMHSTEKNQNGRTITVERGLGDRSRRITRTRDQTGREEARDTLRNIQFEETDEFDQEWSQAARRLPGGNNNGQGQ